ncbi:FitA-like ribbon-helix-helix domain-containing protein [Methylobacterium frigidaeris]|nr:plasmid stabilization protein [Methylobacterium frigidaeris]PIK69758.1 plasmid stabilization protein [Methylobacterium frigidaeris]
MLGRYVVTPAVTIRNLPDEAHRALKVRAAQHGRGTEAEMRDILEAAGRQTHRVNPGTLLSAIGRGAGLTEADMEPFDRLRDGTSTGPMGFECSRSTLTSYPSR